MNRNSLCVLFLISFSVFFVGLFVVSELYASKHINNLILENNSPEDVIELYWKSSFKGDSKIVSQISAKPPEDFLQDCRGIKKSSDIEDKIQVEITSATKNPTSEVSIVPKDTRQNNIFEVESVPSPISNMFNYIYMSKVPFKRIKIKDKIVYQDEAIVNVIESDYKGDFSSAINIIFFLKSENNNWKLIGVVDKDAVPELWKTINYAIPRPQCN